MAGMGQLPAIPAPEVPAGSYPAAKPAAMGCRAPLAAIRRCALRASQVRPPWIPPRA
jgi:hypothetical protein